MRTEPLGDAALIVRVTDEFHPRNSLSAVLMALRHLQAAAIPGVIELAPAYTTIGVFYDPARIEPAGPDESPFDLLATRIQSILNASAFEKEIEEAAPTVEVPVCYDREFAPDLEAVARHAGLPGEEVVLRHSSEIYRVSCVGFTPG